jgi:hypothetical protein
MRKVLPEDSKYYFPLPKSSLRRFFRNVFGPAILGQCITVKIPPMMRGGRALFHFCWQNRFKLSLSGSLGKKIAENNTKLIYIDTQKHPCNTKQEFWELLGKEVGGGREPASIRERLNIITQNNNVIIVLRGITHYKFADKLFWKEIRSLRFNPLVNYIFIHYLRNRINYKNCKYNPIYDLLSRNHYKVPYPTNNEIHYVINRWGAIFNYAYSIEELKAIKIFAQGNYSLIKAACSCLVNNDVKKDYCKFLEEKVSFHNYCHRSNYGYGIYINFNTKQVYFFNRNITDRFSNSQLKLLIYLFKNINKVVKREELGLVLWNKNLVSEYSDNAINQLIYKIKEKLKQIKIDSIQIRSIYGKGYILKVIPE